MIKKILMFFASLIAVFGLNVIPAFAHSVVTPNQAGIASTPTFTLTVPTEKDGSGPTTSVRLILPAGLNFVTPVVQTGWTATVKTGPIPSGQPAAVADDGDVADSVATEIDWTGGVIPTEQKGLFLFSAQVPPTPGELDWKVYQGYSDGSTVSWDLGPNDPQPKDSDGHENFDANGPYSKTMVINDLKPSSTPVTSQDQQASTGSSNLPLTFSIVALALSVLAIGMARQKQKA